MKKSFLICVLAGAILLNLSIHSPAKEVEDPYDKNKGISDNFVLTAGFYMPSLSTNIRLDSSTLGTGTDLNFENDLDMESSLTIFRADGHLRLSRWFSLEFGYYNISRDTTTILNKSIQYGNKIYAANADVNASVETQVIKAALAFSLINDGNVEFGFSVGGNIILLKASLNSITANLQEAVDEIAPIPLVGTYVYVTLSPGLFLKGNLRYFTITLNDLDFSGSALDFRGAVEYYPLKNIGVGASINLFDCNLEMSNIKVEEGGETYDLAGKFDYSYTGISAYVIIAL
jgi:hypothetical protein